jgi:hypothetical protein
VDSDFDSPDGAARRPYRRLRHFTAVVEISTQSQMRPIGAKSGQKSLFDH